MGLVNPRSVGYHLWPVTGIVSQAGTVGTVNGTGFAKDPLANNGSAQSMKVIAVKSATTGAPSAQTFDMKVQHASTLAGSPTAYADYTDPSTNAVAKITQDTSASAEVLDLNVDLEGSLEFLRIVCATGFTGGSSPATPYAVAVVLAGFPVSPVE